MSDIKVLVIDDSAFMRKMISEMINQADGMQVIGTARNGLDGIEKIKTLKPDVVTLDVEMPILDGISALGRIMEESPLPVIMLSSLTTKGAKSTIQAIEYGAVDFISKPSGAISLNIEDVKTELINKINMAKTANIFKNNLKRDVNIEQVTTGNKKSITQNLIHKKTVVAIGVSTGGPKALQQVLTKFDKNFSAPILIVQHMPAKFTKTLAERLDRLTNIRVKEASDGELLMNGTAYIAPGDYHMNIKRIGTSLAISLDQSEPQKGHRPSVNKLFESLANVRDVNKVAVVLTGMGSDGTDGAKQLKKIDKKSILIAESNQSAVIYGMPKSIIENVGADLVVTIDDMAKTITEIVQE
ncbi:protein-glutamate methylesterase/protein-glutamine glutaminase [Bacillaceae bacterium W0354]